MNAALIATNDNQLEQCLVNMAGGLKHAILDLLTFLLHTLQHVDERYRAQNLQTFLTDQNVIYHLDRNHHF